MHNSFGGFKIFYMQNFIKNLKCEYCEKVRALIKKNTSFALSGITNCSKLFLLGQFLNFTSKNIIVITETEQSALKYQNDLRILFDIEAEVFPYQDGSLYDNNSKNLYKYAKQVNILRKASDYKIIIVPVKAMFEKFPDKDFYEKNKITVNINEDIDAEEFSKNLVKMGYKRKTLVADAGEFSIRGDIIDVFPLSEKPYRIELWGDTVTDIRIFDNLNQKSISKVQTAEIPAGTISPPQCRNHCLSAVCLCQTIRQNNGFPHSKILPQTMAAITVSHARRILLLLNGRTHPYHSL